MSQKNKKVYLIPDEHYGVISNEGLAFLTPNGSDSAANSRKDTVDKWRRHEKSEYQKNYDDAVKKSTFTPITRVEPGRIGHVFKNTPMPGFSINSTTSRSRTDNKWWRVIDPRGFELEISTENFLELVLTTNIKKGVIETPLIWARDSGKNYLMLAHGHTYNQSIAYSLKKNSPNAKLSLRDIKLGDTVEMVDGFVKAQYLGPKYLIPTDVICRSAVFQTYEKGAISDAYHGRNFNHSYYGQRTIRESKLKMSLSQSDVIKCCKKRYFFKLDLDDGKSIITWVSTPKIAKVLTSIDVPLTNEQTTDLIMDKMINDQKNTMFNPNSLNASSYSPSYIRNSTNGYHFGVTHVNPKNKLALEYKTVDSCDVDKIISKARFQDKNTSYNISLLNSIIVIDSSGTPLIPLVRKPDEFKAFCSYYTNRNNAEPVEKIDIKYSEMTNVRCAEARFDRDFDGNIIGHTSIVNKETLDFLPEYMNPTNPNYSKDRAKIFHRNNTKVELNRFILRDVDVTDCEIKVPHLVLGDKSYPII